MKEQRTLLDLSSVGKATLKDFELLEIKTVDELVDKKAEDLYSKLCQITGVRQDPCVEDVFSAAIAQARDPDLPLAQCQWWYWSGKRKKEND